MTAAEREPPDESKVDGMIGWRLEQLLAAGYGFEEARALAAHVAVDLHPCHLPSRPRLLDRDGGWGRAASRGRCRSSAKERQLPTSTHHL